MLWHVQSRLTQSIQLIMYMRMAVSRYSRPGAAHPAWAVAARAAGIQPPVPGLCSGPMNGIAASLSRSPKSKQKVRRRDDHTAKIYRAEQCRTPCTHISHECMFTDLYVHSPKKLLIAVGDADERFHRGP